MIVTGASQNIGEQIVYEYCERGAKLVITARRKNKLKEVYFVPKYKYITFHT